MFSKVGYYIAGFDRMHRETMEGQLVLKTYRHVKKLSGESLVKLVVHPSMPCTQCRVV